MNFSKISDQSFLGRILRYPLQWIPPFFAVPILQGKLRGKKWIVRSYNHGCWLGSYEYEVRLLFEKSVKPGQVVFDLGAHVGFYTLLASELVGPNGKVIAFEPLPRNIGYLKKHVQLNQCSNVQIVESAVSNMNGISYFDESKNNSYGFISDRGKFQVKTLSIDDFVSERPGLIPDVIKIDVEGSELLVLKGGSQTLAQHSPILFLETHSKVLNAQCRSFLAPLGYRIHPMTGNDLEEAIFLVAFTPQKALLQP